MSKYLNRWTVGIKFILKDKEITSFDGKKLFNAANNVILFELVREDLYDQNDDCCREIESRFLKWEESICTWKIFYQEVRKRFLQYFIEINQFKVFITRENNSRLEFTEWKLFSEYFNGFPFGDENYTYVLSFLEY